MASIGRKPKSGELVVLENHIRVAQDVLVSLDAQIQAFNAKGKRFKTIIQNMDEFTKLYKFHLEYASEYSRLIGLIRYCEDTQKQSKKLREGSVISPVIDLVSNESTLAQALANLLTEFGMELPDSVLNTYSDNMEPKSKRSKKNKD